MRIALLGPRSFIARQVAIEAAQQGIETIGVGRGADWREAFARSDAVIGFATEPAYRTAPYDEAADIDLAAARIAASCGARFVMLSTRRVYPPAHAWGAVETAPATGDETAYGRNKAQTEAGVQRECAGRGLILRLSNIFGFEYEPLVPRRTFMGLMLRSLREEGQIIFDMSPDTMRDFLPVTTCAKAIVAGAANGAMGTYNLGSGMGTRCGDIAEWLIEGYGAGRLVVTRNEVRDSFYLNTEKYRTRFPQESLPLDLRSETVEIGQRLQDA